MVSGSDAHEKGQSDGERIKNGLNENLCLKRARLVVFKLHLQVVCTILAAKQRLHRLINA